MDLTHDEMEDYLVKIFSGQELTYIEYNTDKLLALFKQPDNLIKMKAKLVYDKAYSKATDEGILPVKELEKLIKQRGLFTDEDENELELLKNKLYAQEVLLVKTTKVKARQDRIKGVISKIEDKIHELEYKKLSKLSMSAEHRAHEDKLLYLCSTCSYKVEDDKEALLWLTYEDILSEEDVTLRDVVLSYFVDFHRGIDTRIVRAVAKSALWRIRYITSMKVAEPLFGVPASQYTSDMLNLMYWSNYYQNIYDMMPEDRPPDSIIEDDDAIDAYMNAYYEERSREDAARRSKVRTQGKLSAFDKEEVIVTQSNELYEDIEYDKPREARQIKDRSDIRKRTTRSR